jgi:ABC-type uncharacterized transport system YnjBCD ATPase subunit
VHALSKYVVEEAVKILKMSVKEIVIVQLKGPSGCFKKTLIWSSIEYATFSGIPKIIILFSDVVIISTTSPVFQISLIVNLICN